jgi:competence protein ComEA
MIKMIGLFFIVLFSSVFALAAVDLNSASQQDFEGLPGVGKKVAEQIIASRPFKSVDDLQNVKGIGAGKLAKLRPMVEVKGATASTSAPASTDAPAAPASASAAAASRAAPAQALNMGGARGVARSQRATMAPGTTVNINTASVTELENLPGIGPVKAQAIVQNRPFASVEDLKKVKGIKEGTLAKIRPFVVTQ